MPSVEKELQALFIENKITLSLAESCTGGEIAARIVRIPDCSLYFLGGVVAYSNQSKVELLNVSSRILQEKGAVSEEVAGQMAEGACQKFHSKISLATSGIAGPTGGTSKKPVGTVCFAIYGLISKSWTSVFPGGREEIISQAVEEALRTLYSTIK